MLLPSYLRGDLDTASSCELEQRGMSEPDEPGCFRVSCYISAILKQGPQVREHQWASQAVCRPRALEGSWNCRTTFGGMSWLPYLFGGYLVGECGRLG